ALETLQAHPTRVVTAAELLPSPGPWVALVELREKLQGAPSCVTVKFLSAMVMRALRKRAVELDATLKVTRALLVLLAGESKVIQGALLDTDQLQPWTVLSETE